LKEKAIKNVNKKIVLPAFVFSLLSRSLARYLGLPKNGIENKSSWQDRLIEESLFTS
jgi:hypothetical protein